MRLAAGYVLLAGICSLIVSQERFTQAGPTREANSVETVRSTRTPAMDSQDRTMSAGPDLRTAAGPSGHRVQDQVSLQADSRGVDGMTRLMRDGIERLERLVTQYPWPTVLFGIGLGFLLARRMR